MKSPLPTCEIELDSERAGLAPEYVEFSEEGMVTSPKGRHNLLRPEAMEAMFVLWRVTRKEVYRDWAWQVFLAFEQNCKARASPTLQWLTQLVCHALHVTCACCLRRNAQPTSRCLVHRRGGLSVLQARCMP